MYSEARKSLLSARLLKVTSDKVLLEIETILSSYDHKTEKKPSIYDFLGIISKTEANEMKQAITDSCETIDENDWK